MYGKDGFVASGGSEASSTDTVDAPKEKLKIEIFHDDGTRCYGIPVCCRNTMGPGF